MTCESVLFTYPARFGLGFPNQRMNYLETVNTCLSQHLPTSSPPPPRPSRDPRDRNHLDATSVADSLVRRQGCQVLLSLCEISSRSSQGLIDDLLVGTFRDALPWTRTMALRNHVRCSMWYAVLVSTTLELRSTRGGCHEGVRCRDMNRYYTGSRAQTERKGNDV